MKNSRKFETDTDYIQCIFGEDEILKVSICKSTYGRRISIAGGLHLKPRKFGNLVKSIGEWTKCLIRNFLLAWD